MSPIGEASAYLACWRFAQDGGLVTWFAELPGCRFSFNGARRDGLTGQSGALVCASIGVGASAWVDGASPSAVNSRSAADGASLSAS